MYVDGYVFAVPKKKMPAYLRLARLGKKLWMEHGAIDYMECVADDVDNRCGRPFPRLLKLKRGEIPVFSWILYKSRAHRDQVNGKVMSDPRLAAMMDPKNMPFDMKRMCQGGFGAIVDM